VVIHRRGGGCRQRQQLHGERHCFAEDVSVYLELHEVTSLADALGSLGSGFHGFLLSPTAAEGLAPSLRNVRGTVVLAIGPEGGFSPDEEKTLEDL